MYGDRGLILQLHYHGGPWLNKFWHYGGQPLNEIQHHGGEQQPIA